MEQGLLKPVDDFSDFINDRARDFTGREWVFAEINHWLAEPGNSRVFLLTGGPGTGKSAVAVRLEQISAGKLPADGSDHLKQGVLSYAHFCQAREDRTLDAVRFVEALAGQLASRYEHFRLALQEAIDPNISINITATQTIGTVAGGSAQNVVVTIQGSGISARAAFDRSVRRPLEVIYRAGFNEPIIVLVDALDEALTYDTGSDIVSLLKHVLADAGGLPTQVRFILTCRSNEKRVLDIITGKRIDLIKDAPPGSVDNDDVSRYARRRLQALAEPNRNELARQIAAKSLGNFLYARFVLDDLLASGRPVNDLGTLELPDKLEGAYHQFLEREVGDNTRKWQEHYLPVLGVLTVARGVGLNRQQIMNITGLPGSITDDVLKTCSQFFASSVPQGTFRLYHESFREYLESDEDPDFQVYPAEAHEAISNFFVDEYDSKWDKCIDEYALQYTPLHLLEAVRRATSSARQRDLTGKLYRLLLDSGFGGAVIGHFRSPQPFFDDLRLGLEWSLERDDVVQIWRYVDRYRTVLQAERQPQRVVADVQAGDFEVALDRTALYGAMPNSQGMMRLWIAWQAAAAKQTEMATRAATLALGSLPPHGFISGAAQEADLESAVAITIGNALSTALQRLLIRLARAVSDTNEGQIAWLRKVSTSWRPEEVEVLVARLSDTLAGWGSSFGGPSSHETIDDLLRALQGAAISADHPMYFREAAYNYQHRLAAALYQERSSPFWQGRVAEVVNRLSLDDYPSYREMALAWIAAAVLCHEDDAQARQALSTVLVGALGVPEPAFGGETVVAALEGLAREVGKALKTDGLAEALKYAGSTTKEVTVVQLREEANLPTDPWAFELLRRNAVAATLHRQGQLQEAELALEEASHLDREDSYAGYRVLACLSLACRWLEWGRPDKAAMLLSSAREDAVHMLDPVLGRERAGLVDALERWLMDFQNGASELIDAGVALRHTGDLAGMMRSMRTQFLAALWSTHPERLKQLVPLALTDITAMDAVLSRLFTGVAAAELTNQPFSDLVQQMDIKHLTRQFVAN